MTTEKVRSKTLARLRTLLLAMSLVLVGLTGVVVTATPASAATGNMLPPFDIGQTWNICQGYNNPAVTHTGTSIYGLDLTGAGCDNSAAGRNVRAPIDGTVYYYQASYGNLCVNIAGGRSYTLTHIDGSVTSGAVTAGELVGTVAAAQPDPNLPPHNGGVAHIHFQIWAAPGCYNNSVIPFDTADNARICGAPDLPASSTGTYTNGTWSGTSFTGASCGSGTTTSTQSLQAPSAITDPATGRNIFYVGADGYIWQWSVQGGAWVNNRLGGSALANTSPSAITESSSGRNVFYVGADQYIWQLSVQNNAWVNIKLTGTGGVAAVAAGSSPSAVVDSSSGRNVFYVGADNQIWQWSIQNNSWNDFKLTGTGGNTAAATGTSPSAVVDGSTGRNIFYVGSDSHIWQWSVQNGSWNDFQISGTNGNQTVAPGTSPSAVADPTTGRNVFYVGPDYQMWQWSVQNGAWNNNTLTGSGGTVSVLPGTSPSAITDSSSGRNIFYFDGNRMVWQWSVQSNAWVDFKLQ